MKDYKYTTTKTISIIRSCKTYKQLLNCKKIIKNYSNLLKLNNYENYHDVVIDLFIEYDKVKQKFKQPYLCDVIQYINNTIKLSSSYNLQSEILAGAFLNLKNNPELSINDALNKALIEWDI